MKKVHVFFICTKRVKKVLIKFLTVQILNEKSTKGKNRGKKYIDFLYENTNFLNMFTLKWEERINLILLHILILIPPPLNWTNIGKIFIFFGKLTPSIETKFNFIIKNYI
ncbi:unnamed protein product [Blepharisma stoltei]|uniref:Uncharacterized protein n=1 Tax=Blepharisma stoltei TaxID=1481888 RepID=A0AAU9JS39_9CILI|nr:unnamed protein product [Blepharisma stoltei]